MERGVEFHSASRSIEVPSVSRRKLHILVAEDNPVNQMILEKALQSVGHTVVLAKNGREAVEAAFAADFDVILMDHQMPELSGIEATHLIKARLADVPIVAVSANAMEGDKEMFLNAGMDGYLAKPFRLPDLLEVIERCTQLKAV